MLLIKNIDLAVFDCGRFLEDLLRDISEKHSF